jgi:hypothetical protein
MLKIAIMKTISFLSISILLFVFGFVTVSQSATLEYIMIDHASLELKKPLVAKESANAQFDLLRGEFSDLLKQESFYQKEFIDNIVKFIASNKSTTRALDSKIYLAFYLSISCVVLGDNAALLEDVENDIIKIFSSIHLYFADTWQGKFSLVCSSSVFFQSNNESKHNMLEKAKASRPILLDVEDEPGFKKLRSDLNDNTPLDISLSEQIIKWELEIGNIDNAQQEVTRLKKKYSNSNIVKRLEARVASD